MEHYDRRKAAPARPASALVTLFLAGCLTACQSAPPPEQMARTTLQTAPADLQLLCSNAVATAAKVENSKVLPLSSSVIDAESYSVELNANGRRYQCIVDSKGVIRSVQPT